MKQLLGVAPPHSRVHLTNVDSGDNVAAPPHSPAALQLAIDIAARGHELDFLFEYVFISAVATTATATATASEVAAAALRLLVAIDRDNRQRK